MGLNWHQEVHITHHERTRPVPDLAQTHRPPYWSMKCGQSCAAVDRSTETQLTFYCIWFQKKSSQEEQSMPKVRLRTLCICFHIIT